MTKGEGQSEGNGRGHSAMNPMWTHGGLLRLEDLGKAPMTTQHKVGHTIGERPGWSILREPQRGQRDAEPAIE